MAYLFHQNMRTYGGHSVPRNAFFSNRLDQIGNATGRQYIVAGFTEIMNASARLRDELLAIAQDLDPGLDHFVVIAVGRTSVGNRAEYIAIATDTASVPIEHVGGCVRDSLTRQWTFYSQTNAAIPANRTITIPAAVNLQIDNRGVAFVAGRLRGGARYIFGFMHNMYAIGERTLAYRDLGKIALAIRTGLGANYGAAPVLYGGDFNVRPDYIIGRRNPARGWVNLNTRFAAGVGGLPVNTTTVNPYDFWRVTDPAVVNADVELWNQTFVTPVGSDHKGVSLRNV